MGTSLEKRVSRAQKLYGKFLNASENILWADAFYLVLTDARLVSFAPANARTLFSGEQVVTFSAPLETIEMDSLTAVKSKKLHIRLNTGEFEDLNGTVFTDKDIEELKQCISLALSNPKTYSYVEAITSANRDQVHLEAKLESQRLAAEAKAEKKKLAAEAKAEKKRIQEQEKAEFEAKYGTVVVSEAFATKWITIYSKGYVKVSEGFGLLKGDVEKLLDIFGETDITRKTGLGRAVGAAFTLGANIALSPSQRGNIYLTIATEDQTYSIVWQRPDQGSLRTMNRLVSAGKASLARSAAQDRANSVSDSPQSIDLATQLANLAKLREEGLLSESEFEKAKSKLLG